MKTTYRFIIAALAAAVALSSCTKDIAADREDVNPQDGVRTIAISFDTPTKTVLGGPDGLTPRFEEGDLVMVSDRTAHEVCTVHVVNKEAYFTTNLTGKELKAAYPAKYAKLDDAGENVVDVLVPSNQTGRFEDANIAMTDEFTGNKAGFKNQTAILRFYVDRSIGVKEIGVSAGSKLIVGGEVPDGQRISDGRFENGEWREVDTLSPAVQDPRFHPTTVLIDHRTIISVSVYNPMVDSTLADLTDDPDGRICYVAIRPNDQEVKSYDLSVTSITTTQDYEDENIGNSTAPAKGGVYPVQRNFPKVSLSASTMANVFIPYYIKVDVGETTPEYQYWSYCNLGAFLPEEPGLYFAWGEVKGHKADFDKTTDSSDDMVYIVDAFTSDFSNFSEIAKTDGRYSSNWNSTECFQYCNAPYAGESDYTKYTGSDYETLQPEDDAASVNWGGKWRMPTEDEYEALLLAEKTYSSSGTLGLSFQGEEDNQLFFPAVGAGDEKNLIVSLYSSHFGYYWSSTININAVNAVHASGLIFFCEAGEGSVDDAMYRDMGFPIRPIYGAPAEEGTSVDIESIEPLNEGRILY